jgi:thymidylate kinase
MIVAVVGYPGSGKRTLAERLAERLPHLRVVGSVEIRDLLKSSLSNAAAAARQLVEAGRALPDPVLGHLLAEASGGAALLVGYPRNLAQLRSLQSVVAQPVFVICVRASVGLVDERRRAASLGPIEEEHPGALERIDAALAPMIADASDANHLLCLDATTELGDLLSAAQRFLTST